MELVEGGAPDERLNGTCRNCGCAYPPDPSMKVSQMGSCWIEGHDWDLVDSKLQKWRRHDEGIIAREEPDDDLPEDYLADVRSHPAHTWREDVDLRTPMAWGENDTMRQIVNEEGQIKGRVHGITLGFTNETSPYTITLEEYRRGWRWDPDIVLPLPTVFKPIGRRRPSDLSVERSRAAASRSY